MSQLLSEYSRGVPRRVAGADWRSALLPLGVWFGLVTGLGEVALLTARRYLLGRFNLVGQDVMWMAPAAEVLIFGTTGILLHALARRQSDMRLMRAALTLYGFLSALTILLMYYPLHPLAKVVLAAGIGVQFGKLAVHRFRTFIEIVSSTLAWPSALWRSLVKRRRLDGVPHGSELPSPERRDFLIGTGATLGALALGVQAPPFFREWYALRNLPATRSDSPNVLLLVLDTVRASSLSLHGYHRPTTPELTRIAKSGAFFSRAYSHSSWTLPSIASMFTGRYPHELSATWQTSLDSKNRTLAEVLSTEGYATAGLVANTHYCSYESGLQRGFVHYEDYPVNFTQLVNSSGLAKHVRGIGRTGQNGFNLVQRKSASDINRHFLSWLSSRNKRPFFAFLNYIDAHAPYMPPPPFNTLFGPATDRPNALHEFNWEWTPEQIRAEQDAYDGTIAYLDREIGQLLTTLQQRGVLETTLVIIVSDHGELFGEHGMMDHANSLYSRLLHVPLLLIWPGKVPSGVVIQQPVGLRHIAATVLDLTELKATEMPGESLARFWRGAQDRSASSEPILASLEQGIRVDTRWRNAAGSLQSLVVGERHYIRNYDGSEEVYDLLADPGEERNITSASDTRLFRETLEKLLREGSGRSGRV